MFYCLVLFFQINDRLCLFILGSHAIYEITTFNQKKILLEVNLFNFSGNLYNKKLRVEFLKFIRKEVKFKGINQLKKQIILDLKVAKRVK